MNPRTGTSDALKKCACTSMTRPEPEAAATTARVDGSRRARMPPRLATGVATALEYLALQPAAASGDTTRVCSSSRRVKPIDSPVAMDVRLTHWRANPSSTRPHGTRDRDHVCRWPRVLRHDGRTGIRGACANGPTDL